MTTPAIAKAIREDYSPAPFFNRQEYQPGAERWVAWSNSLHSLKELFYSVLNCFPEEVEILLKLERESHHQPSGDPWLRYHGVCPLQDGGSQLCVRCVGGGDYLVFDEHGIFFVYSDDDGFRACCQELGFEERIEPLLYEAGHWHYRPGGNDKWEPFLQQFGLKAV